MTVCFPCLRIKWQYGLPCLRIKTVCGVLTYRQFKTFRAQKALFFYRIHSNRFEKRLINSEPTLCIRGGPPAASPVPDLRRANIASPRAAPAAPRAACTFAPTPVLTPVPSPHARAYSSTAPPIAARRSHNSSKSQRHLPVQPSKLHTPLSPRGEEWQREPTSQPEQGVTFICLLSPPTPSPFSCSAPLIQATQ
jgi:hypothetical protein